MKYNGKYSLVENLLKETSPDWDMGYVDADGELSAEWKKEIERTGGDVEEEQKKRDHKYRAKSEKEMEEFRGAHIIRNLNQKFEEHKRELEKEPKTRKVKTYRDLKLVLHSMTMTEEELERRDSIMKKAGWAGIATMIGLKIAKNVLATVTGLDQITKWAGIIKDVGESVLGVVGQRVQDMPPEKARTNPLSDALTLHQDYSEMLDPELEQDMFNDLLSLLEEMEEEGTLDDPIHPDESSFTEYAEAYLENNVGSKKTGIHGAKDAGDTAKLTDIKIPDLNKKQQELFYAYLNIPMEVFKNAHEIA